MTRIADLPTPALLLDLDALEENLGRMAARARSLGVALRPHIKTHKCIEIGERQRALGVAGLTVSTLYEARVFADHGFNDLTWAFPVILNRIPEAAALADRITLHLVVDTAEAVAALQQTGHHFRVFLKLDCGYHRAGMDPQSDVALEVAGTIAGSRTLTFDGILTHSGHSYHGRSPAEICGIAEQERSVMADFAARLRDVGIKVPNVSVGSTPAMSQAVKLDGITEARPGNYAFYDYTQVVLGACAPRDCAVTVLASVVSAQAGNNHAVIDAGALSLSKDVGSEFAPQKSMGEIFADYAAGTLHQDLRVSSVSQEHGVVSGPLPVGALVRILPNHSCLTAAQFDEYVVVRGDDVVDRWKIWRGRD